MKRSKGLKLLIFLSFFLLTPSLVWAKSWYFEKWAADITVNPDSTFVVRETQTVNFQGSFSWLARDIALKRLKKISEIKVYNEEGNLLGPGSVEVSREIGKVKVKINFQAQDEQKTWTIEYKVSGGIGFFKEYDELYWNAVSQERDVPINKVEVLVYLPQDIPEDKFKQRLFVGGTGSKDESKNFEVVDGHTLRYWGENVGPYKNFTIVAGWPKGIVKKDWWLILSPYLWFAIPLLAFIFLFWRWWTAGRDPKMKGTIIAQYEPPRGMAPAEMGGLVHEKSELRDISATLVDLAYRGYLRIVEQEKKGLLSTSRTYNFVRQKDFHKDPRLKEHEGLILEGILGYKSEVSLDDLKNSFYRHIPGIKKAVFGQITRDGYFNQNPEGITKKYVVLGMLILVFGGGGAFFYLSQLLPAVALGLVGLFTVIFGRFMPAKTKKGADAKWHSLGFKEYLQVAERFRLQANVDPKTFEKYLSYAMVFGVEREWANRFIDIYKEPPDWYVPATGVWAAFVLTDFTSNLSGMSQSFSSVFSSSPSSSSGFGGGGFAGGGGGGGGSSAG